MTRVFNHKIVFSGQIRRDIFLSLNKEIILQNFLQICTLVQVAELVCRYRSFSGKDVGKLLRGPIETITTVFDGRFF